MRHTTRSAYLLRLCESFLGIGGETTPPPITPLGWGIRGAIAAGSIGLLAHQIHRVKAQTHDKIRQAGLGPEHNQAQTQLRNLRTQHVATLGLNPALGMKIRAQKAHVNAIENAGLERYHRGMVTRPLIPPPSRAQR